MRAHLAVRKMTMSENHHVGFFKNFWIMIGALCVVLVCTGCAKKTAESKTYPMTATIVSRDARGNTVNLDNKEIPGVMESMKMDYALRGANVDSLPPNGTPVTATLHEQDGQFWVTDVKAKK